ncbi:hypothetical protein SLE2022_211060 [Rubroshorea leprosula]
MLRLPTIFVLIQGRPLKVYLSTFDKSVNALVAKTTKEARSSGSTMSVETPKAPSQIQLITKSQPILYLLTQPILTGRLANWLIQLSQYDITCINPITIKGQAVVDLLSKFSNEVLGGEVATTQEIEEELTLYFDGSSTAEGVEAGIVLRDDKSHHMVFSFKLDFQCTDNTAEYKAYIIGLAMAKEVSCMENQLADALAIIALRMPMVENPFNIHIVRKEQPIYRGCKSVLLELLDHADWREILAMCVSDKEAYHRLREIHDRTCGHTSHVSLYCQVQRGRYYWPHMAQQSIEFQQQCVSCQRTYYQNEECFFAENVQDWHHPYMEYFAEGIWPESLKDVHNLKRSLSKFFMDSRVLFHTNFTGEPIRCLSVHASLIHSHPNLLQDMKTPWLFHTWDLDLIGPIHHSSEGYIWILVAIEYFTKWVEAVPFRKATARVFTVGQMVLRALDHVRKNIAGPSKFAANWEGPFIVTKALDNRYYHLKTHKGESLLDPVNAKWLKPYYC